MAVVYTNTRGRTRSLDSLNVVALEYVHSEPGHVRWDYVGRSFSKVRANTHIDQALKRYVTQLRNQLQVIDGSGVNILSTLDDDTLIYLMDDLAEQADAIAQEYFSGSSSDFLGAVGQAYSNANAISQLQKGNSAEFDAMMDGIYKALHEVSSLTAAQWNAFKAAYKASLGGDQMAIAAADGIISSLDLQVGMDAVKKVGQYLLNISTKIGNSKSKRYTASQMAGTLRNAMGAIGEQFAALQSDIMLDIDNTVYDSVELVGAKTSRSRTGFQGGKATTSKVDVAKRGGLQITSTLQNRGKMSYLVKGELNSSVKWFNETVASKNKGRAAGATFGDTITIATNTSYINWIKRVFGSSISSMYGVYNTLAFSNSSQGSGYAQIIKTSVIQDALDLFLAGKGTAILKSQTGATDLNALFVLNGRIYPIAGILAAAVQEIRRNPDNYGSNPSDLVYLQVKGDKHLDNSWEGGESRNLQQAFARSEKVKKQINKINFSVQLNPNALVVLFPRLGVQPII